MKKQLLLLVVMMLLPLAASADAVEIDGIYYNLITKGNVAEVTKNPNKYTGSIIIPDKITYNEVVYSVTSIGDAAFSHCKNLTSITIPNSVTSILSSAFYGCSGLTIINIPNSVSSIGSSAFSSCTNLTSIILSNSVTKINQHTFRDCTGLTSVTIPASVTNIDSYAFEGCSGLLSLYISDNVETISYKAFSGCSHLNVITIGRGINFLNSLAFEECIELSDVYCYAENVPYTKSDAFENSYIEYATLHVPEASISAYQQAEPWKNFKSIIATDSETPTTQKCEKPTISYENGQLKMSCTTEGVEYVTDITNADIKKHYDATISLTATYNISVYATKSGYENSDVVTASLCWIEQEPKTEGLDAGITQVPAKAILIQNEAGSIKVQGADEGTPISVYGINGSQAGSAVSRNGAAFINTNFRNGDVVIVKVGQNSVKILMK